jgi:probable F420-dependent oxidoreductase
MTRFQVGCQLWPQHTTIDDIRRGWRTADDLGADSIWTWDHFFPLSGDPEGSSFEGWSLLAAMAADTSRAKLGTLVSCLSYRNPDLLADMARTVDHLSGGRLYLGLGAGWFERDYKAYGIPFGTAKSRLAALEEALPRIRDRLGALSPLPAGKLPIMIGGGGEKVTLRLVATYADAWNGFPPADEFQHKNEVLDSWCEKVGRNPNEIERTVAIFSAEDVDRVEDFVAAGATHVILGMGAPFDFTLVEKLRQRAG